MINLEEENRTKVKAFLVGFSEYNEEPLELKGLVKTLGLEIKGICVLKKIEPSPAFGMGKGKAEEIAFLAKENETDCIIFDFEINPTQQRNFENLAKIPCFDRSEVILRIFASRAQTKEATLQVELAKLVYSLPRLAHSYGDMARQRGGSYGAKGSGETQLELDRRAVMEKIAFIKKELKNVVKERNTQRKRRDKIPVPSCAIVGYTNAGKSTLLNALTGSNVFVEDALFATLDPTTRKLSLDSGCDVLLTDTVGFISNLPHTLIDAFKSTLEEAVLANVIMIVVDVSDENYMEQYKTTIEVLTEIGADLTDKIVVLNKMDQVVDDFFKDEMRKKFPDAIEISALRHEGFDTLKERISIALLGGEKTFFFPLDKSNLVSKIYQSGVLIDSDWTDEGLLVKARVRGKLEKELNEFIFLNKIEN